MRTLIGSSIREPSPLQYVCTHFIMKWRLAAKIEKQKKNEKKKEKKNIHPYFRRRLQHHCHKPKPTPKPKPDHVLSWRPSQNNDSADIPIAVWDCFRSSDLLLMLKVSFAPMAVSMAMPAQLKTDNEAPNIQESTLVNLTTCIDGSESQLNSNWKHDVNTHPKHKMRISTRTWRMETRKAIMSFLALTTQAQRYHRILTSSSALSGP